MKFRIQTETARNCAARLKLAMPALSEQVCMSTIAYTAGHASRQEMLQAKRPAEAPSLPLRTPRGASEFNSRAEPLAVLANRFLGALRQAGDAPWLKATFFDKAAEEDEYGQFETGVADLVSLLAKVGLYLPHRPVLETPPLGRMVERTALSGSGAFLALFKTNALQLSEADVAWSYSERYAYYGHVIKPGAAAVPQDVASWLRGGEPRSEELAQLLTDVRSQPPGGLSEDGQFVRLQQCYVMCGEDDDRMRAAVGVDFDLLVHRELSRALATVRLCGGMTDVADGYDQIQLGEAIYHLLHHSLRALSWAMVGARDMRLDVIVTARPAKPSAAIRTACSSLATHLQRSALFGRQWETVGGDMDWGDLQAELDREARWKVDAKPGLNLELAGRVGPWELLSR